MLQPSGRLALFGNVSGIGSHVDTVARLNPQVEHHQIALCQFPPFNSAKAESVWRAVSWSLRSALATTAAWRRHSAAKPGCLVSGNQISTRHSPTDCRALVLQTCSAPEVCTKPFLPQIWHGAQMGFWVKAGYAESLAIDKSAPPLDVPPLLRTIRSSVAATPTLPDCPEFGPARLLPLRGGCGLWPNEQKIGA